MAELGPIEWWSKHNKLLLIRSFRTEDYQIVDKFLRNVAEESTHTLKYPEMPIPSQEKVCALWNEYCAHPVNLHLGAFMNDQVVGHIRVFQRNSSHPWIKHIATFVLATSKDQWGQGIGRRLLELAEDHARAAGISRIEAEVRCSNTNGVALYKNMGFKIEGTREKAAFINGEFQDEYFIAKILSP